jgi:hypothetical protein
MKGALLLHDLRVQWRSVSSIVLQSTVSLILLLLIGQVWSGSSFSTADIDVRGRELFRMLGFIVAVLTMLWTPLAGVRLLTNGRMNNALMLALQTPSSRWGIVSERYAAWLVHAMLPAMISLPVSMACYTVGSVDFHQVVLLYVVISVLSAKLVAIGMLVACRVISAYSVLRWVYGIVLVLMLFSIIPMILVSLGVSLSTITFARCLTLLSPAAAIMQAVRIGGRQVVEQPALIYILSALTWTGVCLFLTTGSLDTDAMLSTGRHARRHSWITPFLRKYLAFSERQPKRNFLTGQYHLLFIALLGLSVVIGFAGSRHPSPQTTAALAALVVKLAMLITLLGAPGLAAAIISQHRQRGTWQVAGMTRLTSIELVLPKVLKCCIKLAVLVISLLPACLVISHLDLTGTWSIQQFITIQVMFILAIVSWSVMIGSFMKSTGQSYIAAYLSVLLLYTLVPFIALSIGTYRIIKINLVKNYCPPQLVIDALSLDHQPEYQLSPDIVPYFLTITLTCLIITITRVWFLRQPK